MLIKKVPLQIKPPSSVVICIANDYADMAKYMNDNAFPYPENIDPGDDMNGYVAPESGGDIHFVILSSISGGEIAHETQHFLNRVFDDIGYTPELINDELQCAILEYFVNYITDLIALSQSETTLNKPI